MVAVQGMNIEILPPEGKTKYVGQLITFSNAVQRSPRRVRLPHQMREGNIHEPQAGADVTNVPTERQTEAFRRVTPSLLYASGKWTMTKEMKEKLQTTQRRMMRMIIQTEKNRQVSRSRTRRKR